MIKISGGSKRGQRIHTPNNRDLRPTSGKVKAALFNILADKIRQAEFLELFAGSGSIGIEALSRGARHCTFVEKDKSHFRLLQHNVERLNYQSSSTLICNDAMKFRRTDKLYDLIFVDPPYGSNLLEKLLPEIGGSAMIQKNAILIIEHFKKQELDPSYGLFSLVRRYLYGDTILSFYQYLTEQN